VISFVWASKYPFMAGAGGSENYTAGLIRELMKRGIPTRLITIGFGKNDGRQDFPDIAFKSLRTKRQLSLLDDTLIFTTYPLSIKTRRQSYAIMHCPPYSCGEDDPLFKLHKINDKQLLAPSKFSAGLWEDHLSLERGSIPVIYPFADSSFGTTDRPWRSGHKVKLLFTSRLHPDKGVYTLLAALHLINKSSLNIQVTATTAGDHSEDGKVVRALLDAHPFVNVVPARRDANAMARLMSRHDVVVMPSTDIFWKEFFGMVSVEAQHAGCRVVASNSGGLPETDCGNLMLVKPDNPKALADGIVQAAKLGPVTASERMRASTRFTVQATADTLLATINQTAMLPQKPALRSAVEPLLNQLS